ncbi:MAG: hypothetical protein LBT55_03515 [Clostridiaceae bacterium]|jgi:hypothetical protein|nr:hypothetical protein [Clostridiaceae bacterium]
MKGEYFVGILWALMALILAVIAYFAVRTYLKMPLSDRAFDRAAKAFGKKDFEKAATLFAHALKTNKFKHANKCSCLVNLAFIRIEMHDAKGAGFYAKLALAENPESRAAREILDKIPEDAATL